MAFFRPNKGREIHYKPAINRGDSWGYQWNTPVSGYLLLLQAGPPCTHVNVRYTNARKLLMEKRIYARDNGVIDVSGCTLFYRSWRFLKGPDSQVVMVQVLVRVEKCSNHNWAYRGSCS
jgi:hypothetical protein